MILPLLALVTVTFAPPAPTVGDLVTVDFPAAVSLERSEGYEIVAQSGSRAIVRTFRPGAIILSGQTGETGFRNLVIPVHSVLASEDDMTPAPLAPPLETPQPRALVYALSLTALAAVGAWLAVWRLLRRPARRPVAVMLAPGERFRQAVLALQSERSHPYRWAALADETRRFLAETRRSLGSELTTSELLPRLAAEERVVEGILRQGDLEKFSTTGPSALDFDALAVEALALADDGELEAAGATAERDPAAGGGAGR